MRVLIVDDSKVMRMMVSKTLRAAGYEFQLFEADSGVTALKAYEEHSPQLVLSDWNMPEMTGMELLENLMKREPTLRFGFVTSEQTDDARERAFAAGARFLISKPFTPEAFRANIDAAFAIS
jgi:two-component system chemotaxis response regulator CheY